MIARRCARPTLRGLEPTSTNETAVIASADSSSTHHRLRRTSSDSASVTSTAAVVSATTRTKFTALTWAPTSAAIAFSEHRGA